VGYEEIDQKIAENSIVVLDGGTGTEVYRRGVQGRHELPWAVNGLLYAPEVVRDIHLDYLRSGANVVIANSFYTTEYALGVSAESADFLGTAKALTYLAVCLARDAVKLAKEEAVTHEMCVAASVGPLDVANPYDPLRTPPSFTIKNENRQRINTAIKAGADFIMIETMTTLHEVRANMELMQDLKPAIPFWVGFSCGEDGRLFSGEKPSVALRFLDSFNLKPKVVLINCTPIAGINAALKEISESSEGVKNRTPIGVKANLENSIYKGSSFFERPTSTTPVYYADECQRWHDSYGVNLLGGCCGTTPEDIRAITRRLKEKS
jgi:S-methylmethionine-dependent homocysteine/selenocysteine methylase